MEKADPSDTTSTALRVGIGGAPPKEGTATSELGVVGRESGEQAPSAGLTGLAAFRRGADGCGGDGSSSRLLGSTTGMTNDE